MSLRKSLTKPFVVEPTNNHTHTVIFLHRFPQDTPEEELPAKVLSAKLTKNHKTLAVQYPTIRWVFPHPKLHSNDAQGRPGPSHWSNLSSKDVEALELPFSSDLPYITQIVACEAKLVGGLDKIILGGQGDGALAAHDACTSFPELPAACRKNDTVEKAFIDRFFHNSTWTKLEQLKMGGFVGMHAKDGPATRDESDYLLSRRTSSGRIVNHSILRQTPHKFIRGGYKTQTITWDGPRIDAFAWFLTSLGIKREGYEEDLPSTDPSALAPKQRPVEEKKDTKPELTPQQRHMNEIKADKKANEETRRLILLRIEEDKRNRRYRKERERAARLHATDQNDGVSDAGGVTPESGSVSGGVKTEFISPSGYTDLQSEDDSETEAQPQQSAPSRRRPKRGAKPWEDWATMPEELITEWEPKTEHGLTEAQARALGIPKKEDD